MSQLIMNNVVKASTLREIQSKTLKELASILKLSFGPNGSNACIKKENALTRYSKDGHTIISSLHYNGIIEQSIKDDVESITRHIVKTVGDGTTSAVILSSLIFEGIAELETKYSPADIARSIERVVNSIKDEIKKRATQIDLKDVYDIAMISTNGNIMVSNLLKDIYEEFGVSVFIDVTPSIGEEFIVKSYNGMTLNTGYCDSCYVTDSKNNTSVVDNPEVYFFEHPIDTRELGVYLDAILSRNIISPVNSGDYNSLVPTVIFAPKISQDMSSIMDSLTSTMASMPVNNRLPICIITDFHEPDQLNDLAKMCGAKLIRKYIDAATYMSDVERGVAPTPETIYDWAGRCERVVSYSDKTTFIRPSQMYKEDGSYSELYENLLNFLEVEIKKSKENGEDARTIGTLKRRLHSLKSNLVELFVGGITQADRDSLRDLIEDAVLNIRSAAENGVGLGANMTAASVIYNNYSIISKNNLDAYIKSIIYDAYAKLVYELYKDIDIGLDSIGTTDSDYVAPPVYTNPEVLKDEKGEPGVTPESVRRYEYFYLLAYKATNGETFNIRENRWTNNVKTSIMSDITIIDTVSRIVGIMATCNQFIVPTAMHNIYENKR